MPHPEPAAYQRPLGPERLSLASRPSTRMNDHRGYGFRVPECCSSLEADRVHRAVRGRYN
jgi:hypothetical protein